MHKVAQKTFWLVWTCDKPSVVLELSTSPCRKMLENEYWRSWTHHPQERSVRDVETLPYGQMAFPKALDIASVSKSTAAAVLLSSSRTPDDSHMLAALPTISLHSSCSAAAAHAAAPAIQPLHLWSWRCGHSCSIKGGMLDVRRKQLSRNLVDGSAHMQERAFGSVTLALEARKALRGTAAYAASVIPDLCVPIKGPRCHHLPPHGKRS